MSEKKQTLYVQVNKRAKRQNNIERESKATLTNGYKLKKSFIEYVIIYLNLFAFSVCGCAESDENECIYIDNNFFNTLILSLSTLLLCSLKLYTCIFSWILFLSSKSAFGVSRERMHKINYINCHNKLIIHTMYVLHIYFMCSSPLRIAMSSV